jgi:hypothetical protein
VVGYQGRILMWSCSSEYQHQNLQRYTAVLQACDVFVSGRLGRQQSIYTVTRCFEGKSRFARARAFLASSWLAEVSAGDPLTASPRLLGSAAARAHSTRENWGFATFRSGSAATTTERHRRLSTRPDPLIKYRHNGSQGQQPHLEEPYDHATPLLEGIMQSQANSDLLSQTSARIGSVASACTSTR